MIINSSEDVLSVINSFLDSKDRLRETSSFFKNLPLLHGYFKKRNTRVSYPLLIVPDDDYWILLRELNIVNRYATIFYEYHEQDSERTLYFIQDLGYIRDNIKKLKCKFFDRVSIKNSKFDDILID